MIQENWQLPFVTNSQGNAIPPNVMMLAGTSATGMGNQNYHMANQHQPSFHGESGALAYTADVNYANSNSDIPTSIVIQEKNDELPYNSGAQEHAKEWALARICEGALSKKRIRRLFLKKSFLHFQCVCTGFLDLY